MDIEIELDERLKAEKEKHLTAYGKKIREHIEVLEKYIKNRRLQKSWENYFEKSKKPNQILVVESGSIDPDYKILALLNCANNSLADRILSYQHYSADKIYKEDFTQYYVCGILNDSVTAIWQFETPEFLRFWTHLLGRGMRLEEWRKPRGQYEFGETFYYLDFE